MAKTEIKSIILYLDSSGVLGCPNGKTKHSSKLFFEDSFDELKVVSWKSIPLNENYREALCLLGFSIIK